MSFQETNLVERGHASNDLKICQTRMQAYQQQLVRKRNVKSIREEGREGGREGGRERNVKSIRVECRWTDNLCKLSAEGSLLPT